MTLEYLDIQDAVQNHLLSLSLNLHVVSA